MTPQDIKELLDEVKPHIDPSKEVDKENPAIKKFIRTYKEVTGKTLGTGNCKNCILDAFMEWKLLTEEQLKFLTMERKYKIKDNALIYANHKHYSKANITDEISLELVKANPAHARSYENGDELLADAKKASPKKADKAKGGVETTVEVDAADVDASKATESELDPKIVEKLEAAGVSVEEAKTKSVEELVAIKGIGKKSAEAILSA